jgi:predicted P-loop ATPase
MTINPTSLGYLPDETGNRRYLPVRIKGKIDIKSINKHRDQLFAEAKHLFQSGFPLYIDSNNTEIIRGLADEHSLAETHDEWQSPIIQWLITTQITPLPDLVPAITIWTECLKGRTSDYSQQSHGARIGRILRKLGADYTSKHINGIYVKGFDIKELSVRLRNQSIENVIEQAEMLTEWEE